MIIKKEKATAKFVVREGLLKEKSNFHWHPRTEICLIKKGKCDFYVNGVLYNGDEGDLFVFKSGDIHCFMPEDESVFDLTLFEQTIINNQQIKCPFVKTHITKQELQKYNLLEIITDIFQKMLKENETKDSFYDVIMQSYIIQMYALLSRYFENKTFDNTKDVRRFEDFQKILDYISENYANDISLSDISNELNYSVSNVSLMFPKYVDMNFKKYLDNIRVNRSIELIQNENMSITEVAMSCGFNNIRTFNNVFKSVTGMTPNEVKKNPKFKFNN